MTPDHPVDVPVRAVVVSDEDGGRRARVTATQFARWVEFANHAFRDARVRFTFDGRADLDEIRCTTLNDTSGAGDPSWSTAKKLGNELADRFSGRLVVLVRHGPGRDPTGFAFAGVDHDFVVMGGFDDMNHCGHPHTDALAHEIGHYMGLRHTFVGESFEDVREAEAHLSAHGGDPRAFDGDGLADTPPDPAIRTFECERRESVELCGQTFALPRRNLMSYYDERDSLSPQQVACVRWVLERRRRHGMRLPANTPGPLAHEAEALRVVATGGCSTTAQEMDGYGLGNWSGGAQLFCGAERGAAVTFELPEQRQGDHRLFLYATLAPDFGIVRCTVDGKLCGPPVDLFAPVVLPTGALDLGRVRLAGNEHRISFEVEGKHADSSGFSFGIDAIALES
jgi:hypothetical protein